jgi:glycosyltransferase involved in cell wall biosynthesis
VRIAFYSPRSTHLEPGIDQGGDPIYLNALFEALRERGHEVKVVSRMNARYIRRGRVPARRLLTEALTIRREVKRFSPDGWMVYNPSRAYPDLFGWWQRPKRYILLSAQTWQPKRTPRKWRWLFAFAHRRSLRRADWVTAERPKTAEQLRREGVPAERIAVFTPAVALPKDLPTQIEARRRLNLPLDRAIALCVSRFTELGWKRQMKTEIILQLLGSLVPSEEPMVVIVGDGPGRAEIEERASLIRPVGRVRLFRAVPHKDLVWFHAACDLYAYPDLRDLPRLSILEAQACGRPVLTMRTPSAELTVANGRTGILADDVTDFSRQLASLAGDRVRCERMGRAARAYVTSRHSIDCRAEQIERALRLPDPGRAAVERAA